MALIAKPINAKTLPLLETLYADFTPLAQSHYRWNAPAVPFAVFKQIVEQGYFQGYGLFDNDQGPALGMLLFELTPYDTLDIRLLHLNSSINPKTGTTILFEKLLNDWDQQEGPSAINFAMIAPAHLEHIQYLPWVGLKAAGQAVMQFNFQDELTASIYQQQVQHYAQKLPEGVLVRPWQPEDADTLGPLVFSTFKNSVDALWDPRLWQAERVNEVINFITQGPYGQFIPQATSVMVNKQQQPIAFCFMSQTTDTEANIPLIGVAEDYQKQGLGPQLILHSIKNLVQLMTTGQLGVNTLSATVATDNYSALRMYRHLGFEETYWYPHAYITKAMRNAPSVITNC